MNTEELLKQNIEALKVEERNLVLVVRKMQAEIAELASNKKKIIDSTEALNEDKKTAVSEYQEISGKVEALKLEVAQAYKDLDIAKVEANKIHADAVAEKATVEVERNQLENDKAVHQTAVSNLAEDKRDFQTKVDRLTKALE